MRKTIEQVICKLKFSTFHQIQQKGDAFYLKWQDGLIRRELAEVETNEGIAGDWGSSSVDLLLLVLLLRRNRRSHEDPKISSSSRFESLLASNKRERATRDSEQPHSQRVRSAKGFTLRSFCSPEKGERPNLLSNCKRAPKIGQFSKIIII